jgi:NDP-sugar pyrophosphorylase family protein
MKIIVPMAGFGDRFVKAGYQDPKPLIKVNGKRIIEYICEMFDIKNDDFVFICNEMHLQQTDMQNLLKSLIPSSKILTIPPHKKGPVFTVLNSDVMQNINDDEEVIVTYCDNPYVWNYEDFKNWVKEKNSDGCILSHAGFHPHRLSPTFMAHIKDDNLKVLEIKEKEPYSDNFITEQASTGTYYFKKGEYIRKYFNMLMDLDINYKGEYYVTLVYNLLIKDNLLVHAYPTEFVTVFGTPEEVAAFEAWQTILKSPQRIKNNEDLIMSFEYWKRYNERKTQ